EMAVDAVGADVELAADEPFGVRFVPLQHAVPAPGPQQRLGLLRPEPLGVVRGALAEALLLGHALDMRGGGEGRWRGEGARFLEDAGDVRGGGRGHARASSRAGGVAGKYTHARREREGSARNPKDGDGASLGACS